MFARTRPVPARAGRVPRQRPHDPHERGGRRGRCPRGRCRRAATSGSLTSSVELPDVQAIAFQDASGGAAASAEGFAADGPGRSTGIATSVWTETLTNTTGSAAIYEALISIPEIQLYFSGSGTHSSQAERREAGYSIAVELDGSRILEAGALLQSGIEGHELFVIGTDLGGVQDAGEIRYRFAPFTSRIPLGRLAPDESLSVLYGMQAVVSIPGLEVLAEASIGDPLGSARSSIEVTSRVPEPGMALLLVAGLALAAATRIRAAR